MLNKDKEVLRLKGEKTYKDIVKAVGDLNEKNS